MPANLAAVTTAWLEQVFSQHGIAVRLRGFRAEPVGTGLMALTHRLIFDYLENPAGAPASLILKTTADGAMTRKLGKRGAGLAGRPGLYASEVRFYAELSSELPIRTPRLYAYWISDEEDEFLLLLEDIALARSGDEMTGCNLAEAKLAMASIAGLHAPYWNNELFDKPGWLMRPTKAWAETSRVNMDRAVIRYRERHEAIVPEADNELIWRFIPHYAGWFYAEGRNVSLTHNDFRLDNLMFTAAGDCVTVDWQMFTTAHPGRDTGLFLGCSVPTELRRAHEETLLRCYHDRLCELGIKNYSFEDCYEDFKYGVFIGIQNAVIGMSAVSMTGRGMDMFLLKLARGCATIRDHDALQLFDA